MKDFARATKLSSIAGRADYISNPARQEAIVATSAPVDWKPYQDFERANQKTDKRNNEGREVIVALPNEWRDLPGADLTDRAARLAAVAAGKSTDLQWAVHWNKAHTDLHLHVVFSERQREESAGKWDRDIYLTPEGKVARTKAERARNEDGTFKPPVHRKGEEKGGFTAKDTKYKSRAWLPEMKQALRQEFQRYGVQIDEPEPFHQFHEGKGKEAPRIHAKNLVVQTDNARLRELSDFITEDTRKQLLATMKKEWKGDRTVVLHFNAQQEATLTTFQTPEKALAFARQTEQAWRDRIAGVREAVANRPNPDALIAAAKSYYRESFALSDTRRPLDLAAVNAPQKLRNALQELLEARDKEMSCFRACDALRGVKGLFRGKERKQAEADLFAARREADRRFEVVAGQVHFTTEAGRMAARSNPAGKELQDAVAPVLYQLDRAADEARRTARPADALEGSQTRCEAARYAFRAELDKFPAEDRQGVTMAITALLDRDRETGNNLADFKARSAVLSEVNSSFAASQPEQEKEQRKSRGDHER